jgi:transcriptional regulator with XRE-family HTH domain
LTQTRLAELLGVTPAAVNQWESDTSKPSAKYWRRIARAEALGIYALSEDYAAQPASEQTLKEPGVGYSVGSESPPDMTFSTDPEVVRLVIQCQRLAYGHQVNPTFATEISHIQPLPHQRTAVYERMLRYDGQFQSRLRFLLADLPERLDGVRRSYDLREAELIEMRQRYHAQSEEGNAQARAELNRIKARQRALSAQHEAALAALAREPELIAPGE